MSTGKMTTSCNGCGRERPGGLRHHLRLGTDHKRYCTGCVLKNHPGSFCFNCFDVFEVPPPSNAIVKCANCASLSHSTCANLNSAAPLCPVCSNPSFLFFNPQRRPASSSTPLDLTSAKVLLAAATIASHSMRKAAAAAHLDADRKVRESAFARKRVREALEKVVTPLPSPHFSPPPPPPPAAASAPAPTKPKYHANITSNHNNKVASIAAMAEQRRNDAAAAAAAALKIKSGSIATPSPAPTPAAAAAAASKMKSPTMAAPSPSPTASAAAASAKTKSGYIATPSPAAAHTRLPTMPSNHKEKGEKSRPSLAQLQKFPHTTNAVNVSGSGLGGNENASDRKFPVSPSTMTPTLHSKESSDSRLIRE